MTQIPIKVPMVSITLTSNYGKLLAQFVDWINKYPMTDELRKQGVEARIHSHGNVYRHEKLNLSMFHEGKPFATISFDGPEQNARVIIARLWDVYRATKHDQNPQPHPHYSQEYLIGFAKFVCKRKPDIFTLEPQDEDVFLEDALWNKSIEIEEGEEIIKYHLSSTFGSIRRENPDGTEETRYPNHGQEWDEWAAYFGVKREDWVSHGSK